MKIAFQYLIGILVISTMFMSCQFSEYSYRDLSDIVDKRLGILVETMDEEHLAASYPKATVIVYDKAINLFMDMEAKRCDVAVLNEETAIHVMSRNKDYTCLDKWNTSDKKKWYIVVPKDLVDKEILSEIDEESWWKGWGDRIYRNLFAENAWKLILGGLYTTVIIFIFGAILAICLGALLTYMHINHRWMWLYRPLHWFIFTIHDIPSVVLMMFFYYVVFASVSAVNGICVTIIALGVYSSATLAKIFTIHIEQIGKEQRETAIMLGFTPIQIYRFIILPQAVKSMLPLVISEMKVLLRATSYAGYIAQKDLVKAVDVIRSQTYDAFVPLVFISLLYLALSWMIVRTIIFISTKLFHHD